MPDLCTSRSRSLKTDILSGITVSLALVPEAVAFAFVAGVSPVVGLYSSFFIGLVSAIFGGRPGMISGATGAMAVIIVALVAIHGIEYLFPAVILCGVLQMMVGFGRLGSLIRMVPHSVVLGFVNGLAIVIFMAQLGGFQTITSLGELTYIQGPSLFIMFGLIGLTMAIIWLLPRITKAVPASLVAILVVTGLAAGLNSLLDNRWAAENQQQVVLTVGDMLLTNEKAKVAANIRLGDIAEGLPNDAFATAAEVAIGLALPQMTKDSVTLSAGLPRPFFLDYAFPPMTFETLRIIFPFALILAAVGLIESLMTLTLVDEVTETRGNGNRECLGQGLANVTCGLFGGMGGCAMIGQSLINVNSGGRGRISGVAASVCLLAFVLFLAPWIEMIPMVALVGVMFMVVIGTFEWATLKMFHKVPKSDYLVMVLVAGYTAIMHDLAMAVVLGIIASAVIFAWQHGSNIGAEITHDEFGSKKYQLHGPLFFASATSFKDLFNPKSDPDDVTIDFYFTRVYDQSGLEAISWLADKYRQHQKCLHLTNLSPECRRLLDRAADLVEVSLREDFQLHVHTDRITRLAAPTQLLAANEIAISPSKA